MKIGPAGIARDLGGKSKKALAARLVTSGRKPKAWQAKLTGAAHDVCSQAADATRAGAFKVDRWACNAIATQPYGTAPG
jgi:hypothetical protein